MPNAGWMIDDRLITDLDKKEVACIIVRVNKLVRKFTEAGAKQDTSRLINGTIESFPYIYGNK